MEIILAAGAAVLGAILGSFINALSYRWGTGVSIAAGRSRCMRCGHTLSAGDLIPVVSYIFLRGRCRYCGSRISAQYPVVELAGALIALLVFFAHWPGLVASGYWLAVWMILLFVAAYDLRHKVIPWSCSLALAVLGLVHAWTLGFGLWDLAAGPVLAAPLLLLFLVSRGRWMGLGDGVLMLGLGWLLGLTMGLTALCFAFWTGAAVGIVLIAAKKGVTMRSEVPFAPFLIAGAAAAHFLHVDLFSTLPLFFS